MNSKVKNIANIALFSLGITGIGILAQGCGYKPVFDINTRSNSITFEKKEKSEPFTRENDENEGKIIDCSKVLERDYPIYDQQIPDIQFYQQKINQANLNFDLVKFSTDLEGKITECNISSSKLLIVIGDIHYSRPGRKNAYLIYDKLFNDYHVKTNIMEGLSTVNDANIKGFFEDDTLNYNLTLLVCFKMSCDFMKYEEAKQEFRQNYPELGDAGKYIDDYDKADKLNIDQKTIDSLKKDLLKEKTLRDYRVAYTRPPFHIEYNYGNLVETVGIEDKTLDSLYENTLQEYFGKIANHDTTNIEEIKKTKEKYEAQRRIVIADNLVKEVKSRGDKIMTLFIGIGHFPEFRNVLNANGISYIFIVPNECNKIFERDYHDLYERFNIQPGFFKKQNF